MSSSTVSAFLHVRRATRSQYSGFGITHGDFAKGLSAIGTEGIILDSVAGPPAAEAATVFEPIVPPTENLVGFAIIVILCVIVTNVWSEQVVPVSRTKLAISKSRGEVKEYLDELKVSDPSLADSNDDDELLDAGSNSTDTIATATKEDRGFERWLFTDWLIDNKSARQAGRQKEPALPILKNAKWNSGDNPVLAATALLSICVLFSAVTERVASFSHF